MNERSALMKAFFSGDFESALQQIDRLTSIVPDDFTLQFWRGACLVFQSHKERQGLDLIETALPSFPTESVEAYCAIAMLRMAFPDRALQALNKAIALEPDHALAHYLRAAIITHQQENGDAALEMAEEALKMLMDRFPNFVHARLKLVALLIKKENYPEAIKVVAQGVKLNFPITHLANLYYHKAHALYKFWEESFHTMTWPVPAYYAIEKAIDLYQQVNPADEIDYAATMNSMQMLREKILEPVSDTGELETCGTCGTSHRLKEIEPIDPWVFLQVSASARVKSALTGLASTEEILHQSLDELATAIHKARREAGDDYCRPLLLMFAATYNLYAKLNQLVRTKNLADSKDLYEPGALEPGVREYLESVAPELFMTEYLYEDHDQC